VARDESFTTISLFEQGEPVRARPHLVISSHNIEDGVSGIGHRSISNDVGRHAKLRARYSLDYLVGIADAICFLNRGLLQNIESSVDVVIQTTGGKLSTTPAVGRTVGARSRPAFLTYSPVRFKGRRPLSNLSSTLCCRSSSARLERK